MECGGDEMWSQLDELADPREENTDEDERAKMTRLGLLMGRPVPDVTNVRANVEYLADIGIVTLSARGGKEVLDVPENPPKPQERFTNLPGDEVQALEEIQNRNRK